MPLPVKTTIDDVDTIVGYLKSKPTGATIAETKSVIGGKPLDGRKLNAYRAWDLVNQDGDRIILTEAGRKIGRDAAAKPQILADVIDKTRPYRAAIEWAHHQGFDTLALNDLAANWHEHHNDSLGTSAEGSIKDAVTCFFNLAAGAGFGTYVIGRRGTSTRLELDKAAVTKFVESGPSEPPWSGPDLEKMDDDPTNETPEQHDAVTPPADEVTNDEDGEDGGSGQRRQRNANERLRVFIAHGQNMRVVEQVQTMLDLADIEAEVAEEEESTAIPVPNKVLTAMRRSDAGIICVNADENRKHEDGTYTINENVLIEIGAAFVLYDTRVILLWDKRLPVPSNLQGLYRCEYEGSEIGWDAGMKLMKAVSKFRQP
ncbi:MAG: hypothetical protein JWO11_3921 [Nocardioides sp.]|nr:hypothetical protein [Nocardioides sp.]